MKIAPTYERVRPFRWVATQPTGGKHHDHGDGTITVPVSAYCAVAPFKRLAERRLRQFLAVQEVAT